MKVALGIRDFSPSRGGAERYLMDLMRFLAQEGHEVHIFAHRFDKDLHDLTIHKVAVLPFSKGLRILSFALACYHTMRRGDFDVIMGVGNTWGADLLQPHGGVHWKWFWRSLRAYEGLWLRGAKLLGRVLSLKQWAEGIVEDAPYRTGVKRIVAISEMVKRDIIDYYKIPEEHITVIYNGVDIERFHPRNRKYRQEIRGQYCLRSQDTLLLFVSHNFRLKGLRYLIQALAIVKQKKDDIKLLVVGRDRKDPYQRLARKMGCGEDIIFAGAVNNLERYYPSADILVHPTFYDACSLAVLEALASGIPAITTRYNGASGIITDGHEGFVLDDPRDVKVLAEKILILSVPSTLKEVSYAARRLGQQFSQPQCYQKMSKILKDLARATSDPK